MGQDRWTVDGEADVRAAAARVKRRSELVRLARVEVWRQHVGADLARPAQSARPARGLAGVGDDGGGWKVSRGRTSRPATPLCGDFHTAGRGTCAGRSLRERSRAPCARCSTVNERSPRAWASAAPRARATACPAPRPLLLGSSSRAHPSAARWIAERAICCLILAGEVGCSGFPGEEGLAVRCAPSEVSAALLVVVPSLGGVLLRCDGPCALAEPCDVLPAGFPFGTTAPRRTFPPSVRSDEWLRSSTVLRA